MGLTPKRSQQRGLRTPLSQKIGDSHSPDDQITPGREWEKYVTGLRVLSCWAQDIPRCKSVPEMYKRVHEARLAQI